MGTIQQGRQGYIGFAIQDDFTTPNTTPDVFLSFNEFGLQGMHEPLAIRSSRANRAADTGSVDGKKHSEGDVQIDLDTKTSGYLFHLFFGNEVLTTGTPNLHNFYPTLSGNTPAFATITRNYGDTSVEQYNGVCANTMAIEVEDGIATLQVGLMGKFPVTGVAQTPTTVSGTVMSFSRYQVQLGSTLAAASGATPIPVESFTLEANNNIQMIHSSRTTDGANSNDVRIYRLGNLEVSGSYKIFFDSVTERNNYYNLLKQSMVIKFSEGSLEELTFRLPKISYREEDIETGIDDSYAINVNFTAELDDSQAVRVFDALLKNDKSTTYVN